MSLHDKSVVLVGMGGLGCPVAMALAQVNVKRLVLVDHDRVDLSNLQRQVLYREGDIGESKVHAAKRALARRGFLRVEAVATRFDMQSARGLLHDADLVCDGSDSLPTKFLVNDAATAMLKPAVIGGVLRDQGQVMSVLPGAHACYRCLFEEPPNDAPSCATAGVFGALCGVVASWQVSALEHLAQGEVGPGNLLRIENGEHRFRQIQRRPDCAACGGVSAPKKGNEHGIGTNSHPAA